MKTPEDPEKEAGQLAMPVSSNTLIEICSLWLPRLLISNPLQIENR